MRPIAALDIERGLNARGYRKGTAISVPPWAIMEVPPPRDVAPSPPAVSYIPDVGVPEEIARPAPEARTLPPGGGVLVTAGVRGVVPSKRVQEEELERPQVSRPIATGVVLLLGIIFLALAQKGGPKE